MFDSRTRLWNALHRSGLSKYKLAAVGGGHPTDSQIGKFLRHDLDAPTWASDIAALAERISDLIEHGVIAASDTPERMREAVAADREHIENAVDALRMLN